MPRLVQLSLPCRALHSVCTNLIPRVTREKNKLHKCRVQKAAEHCHQLRKTERWTLCAPIQHPCSAALRLADDQVEEIGYWTPGNRNPGQQDSRTTGPPLPEPQRIIRVHDAVKDSSATIRMTLLKHSFQHSTPPGA